MLKNFFLLKLINIHNKTGSIIFTVKFKNTRKEENNTLPRIYFCEILGYHQIPFCIIFFHFKYKF